ncbi:MAG: PIN domain-containing protein [Pedobacter sp.]|uniref:type II toxin-antitoxin system VapC family toxin n=1 Tax=Pedobacter sp. TaxID=1411316 RepID=UPI00280770F9|nr:PIN domain-containing protein [Pedobacter sp.]MDQ8006752.1 PIN domain-containing protein [Pedobacter sp.]
MMEKVFVDTNIVLDLLAKRDGFYEAAQELFSKSDNEEIDLYVSALTIANTHYLLTNRYKADDVRKIIIKFKILVKVLPTDDKIIDLALASDFKDFEDAMQYHTALENNLDIIVTRNKRDFKNTKLPILTAQEYVELKRIN